MSEHKGRSCEAVRDELSDYLDGGLAPETRAALEEHIARCAGCRQFCETLRQTIDLCRQAQHAPANSECLRRARQAARKELARRGLL